MTQRVGEVDVSLGEWLALVLSCGAAIVGLLVAASDGMGTTYTIGVMLFVAGVIYAFYLVKRYFDRTGQTTH
jgi:membrane protein implicated in regulation of membrane protease activity